jgi:hypothetical protein
VPNSLIAAAWGAFACMAVLGTPPAAASSIIYNVNLTVAGSASVTAVTGHIATDGSIGALQPQAIQSWQLTETAFLSGIGPFIGTFGSASGGAVSWTPPSLQPVPPSLDATATDISWHFGLIDQTFVKSFTGSLSFSGPCTPPNFSCRLSFRPVAPGFSPFLQLLKSPRGPHWSL